MDNIKVSLDKLVIEFTKVNIDFFSKYFINGVCVSYGIDNFIGKYGYHYEIHIEKPNKAYLHIMYKPIGEPKSRNYPLRVKTHPLYLEEFTKILRDISLQAEEINFFLCDVAFNIPYSIENIFITSNTGRKMNNYKGTRYFGDKRQRNKHGYCKVYDKKNQLKEVKKEEVVGELTRVEITYRPYPRFPIDELIHHPPKFNHLYTCNVVTDVSNIKAQRRANVLVIQNQLMNMEDFTYYQRKQIKEAIASQQTVDFDALVGQHWKEIIADPLQQISSWQLPF